MAYFTCNDASDPFQRTVCSDPPQQRGTSAPRRRPHEAVPSLTAAYMLQISSSQRTDRYPGAGPPTGLCVRLSATLRAAHHGCRVTWPPVGSLSKTASADRADTPVTSHNKYTPVTSYRHRPRHTDTGHITYWPQSRHVTH